MDEQEKQTVKFGTTVVLQIAVDLDCEFITDAQGYLQETLMKLKDAPPSIQRTFVYRGPDVGEYMDRINTFSVLKALQESVRETERILASMNAPYREELVNPNGPDELN